MKHTCSLCQRDRHESEGFWRVIRWICYNCHLGRDERSVGPRGSLGDVVKDVRGRPEPA